MSFLFFSPWDLTYFQLDNKDDFINKKPPLNFGIYHMIIVKSKIVIEKSLKK